MKRKISNALCVAFGLITLALSWAGAGYLLDKLPMKYCLVYGILWPVQFAITIFWEEK